MQVLHPQYYFYTTTPTMTYGAVALPNYNNIQDTQNIEQEEGIVDSDNIKRKRDQHESFDETNENLLFQKKLKDK